MRLDITTLQGGALKLAAAFLAGEDVGIDDSGKVCFVLEHGNHGDEIDTEDPAQFGYLLKKAKDIVLAPSGNGYQASIAGRSLMFEGETQGVAIFRCFVAREVDSYVLKTDRGAISEISDLLEELQEIEPGLNVPMADPPSHRV